MTTELSQLNLCLAHPIRPFHCVIDCVMSIKAAAKFKAILSVRFLVDKRLNSVFEALIIYPSKARVKQGVNVVDDRKHWPQMLNRQETLMTNQNNTDK